jgi:hypothetical protein
MDDPFVPRGVRGLGLFLTAEERDAQEVAEQAAHAAFWTAMATLRVALARGCLGEVARALGIVERLLLYDEHLGRGL